MAVGLKSVTVKSLHQYLKVNQSTLENILCAPERYYRPFSKEIKGKLRRLCPPIMPLRKIQKVLLRGLYEQVRWLGCLHGGIPGKSIITNAEQHVGRYLVAAYDISDFFPSTTRNMVRDCFISMNFEPSLSDVMSKLVTLNNSLPQGAPTSMAVANLVFRPSDLRLRKLCKRYGLNYTRYVDDIAISGMKDFRPLAQPIRGNIEMLGYKVNDKKTQWQFPHNRQVVTGLVVNKILSPTASFLAQTKELIWRCRTEGPDDLADEHGFTVRQLKQMLYGRARFVQSVHSKRGRHLRGLLVGISWQEST
jgi:RNA-directed DNA polymerase